METADGDTTRVIDPRRARRQRKLSGVLTQLAAAYDTQSRLDRRTDEKSWTQTSKLIATLENRAVTLIRPRHWRLRDLKTGGIRTFEAVGVTLQDGKLTYGDESWPASWSFARITPGDDPRSRQLSIGRVMLKSAVPLRKAVEPDRWSIEVSAEDLPAALTLTACINVSSRLRASTFPVGTYF